MMITTVEVTGKRVLVKNKKTENTETVEQNGFIQIKLLCTLTYSKKYNFFIYTRSKKTHNSSVKESKAKNINNHNNFQNNSLMSLYTSFFWLFISWKLVYCFFRKGY